MNLNKTQIKCPYLFLVLLSSILISLSSCATTGPLAEIAEAPAKVLVAKPVPSKPKAIDNSSLYKRVQEAYQQAEFDLVLELTKNTRDDTLLYYQGMAKFALTSYTDLYTEEEIKVYGNEAIATLRGIRKNSRARFIRNKATLWLAVVLDTAYTNKKTKTEALQYLTEVQNDREYREFFYNETLLYKAGIYSRTGDYANAQKHLNLLQKTPYPQDLVYDYYVKEFISPKQAYRNGIQRLERYK